MLAFDAGRSVEAPFGQQTVDSPGAAELWQTAMEVTELLQRVHAGDQEALNSVIPFV